MVLLQDLDLIDRFLFDEAMDDPEVHQAVLEIIMNDSIQLLSKNEVEKQLQTAPYLRAVRLDVFAMDTEETVYNTEMQKSRKMDLLKRSRFYQSLIDSGLLPTGIINYNQLKDSCIIMITPYDLFGHGKYQYTFEPMCREVPGLKLEDGTRRIFLNTRGKNLEEVSSELVEFLNYVENSTDQVAADSKSVLIKKIHERVQKIKASEEVGVKFMQAWEEKIIEREEGREEGREEKIIEKIKKKFEKTLPPDTIAEHLDEPLEYVDVVCKVVRENPDWTAREILEYITQEKQEVK